MSLEQVVLALDIGGTKIDGVLADMNGRSLATRHSLTHSASPQEFTRCVLAAIEELLQELPAADLQLSAAVIGVPGLVIPGHGTVALARNLNVFEPLPLGALIADALQVPVLVENDVRQAAWGVFRIFNKRNLAYLSLGTGVSAGLVLEGELYRGTHGMAGEIGQMPIGIDRAKTLEDLVSGPAILARAQAADLHLTLASDLFASPSIHLALQQAVATDIATALEWLMLAYDVELLVLGGGVSRNGSGMLQAVRHAVAQRRAESPLIAQLLPDNRLQQIPENANAGLIGGIALALKHVKEVLEPQRHVKN